MPMKDWFSTNVDEDLAKQIIRLKVKLPDDSIVERDFRPDLAVNYETLEEDLMHTPQAYAYWAMVYSEQKSEVSKLDRLGKIRRAKILDAIQIEARKAETRITDKIAKDLVEKDEKLSEIESRLIIANRSLGKLYHIVEAMKMKCDVMRTIAGFKKQELANP